MIRQFNRLFPMKKSELLASNSLKTQPGKPCFNNFDFQARLSISKTGCQFASRSSVDVTMFREAHFPKTNKIEMRQNFLRQNIIL